MGRNRAELDGLLLLVSRRAIFNDELILILQSNLTNPQIDAKTWTAILTAASAAGAGRSVVVDGHPTHVLSGECQRCFASSSDTRETQKVVSLPAFPQFIAVAAVPRDQIVAPVNLIVTDQQTLNIIMSLSLLGAFLIVSAVVLVLMFWALDRFLRPLEQINANIASALKTFRVQHVRLISRAQD